MKVLTVDFETLYSREYSLSKATTEAYIRDPQFEVIGVSVKVDDGPTEWFSGTKKDTKQWLRQFPWDDAVAVAHNAMFDMAILNWHFDIRPKRIADTLSMARALRGADAGSLSLAALAEHYELGRKGHEVLNALGKRRLDFTPEELAAYGEYCCNDTELTYSLFCILAEMTPPSEARLIDLTIRMFSEPVLELDSVLLKSHLKTVIEDKASLLSRALVEKSDLMSNPKFAQLLINCGVVPPTKISVTTGKPTFAFAKSDEDFKALLEHPNFVVQALVAARMGLRSTIEETRTQRFIDIADRGPLPVPLRYYGAHTGRWSGDDKVNLQNLQRGSPIKKAMKAPEGYVVVDCDSSQIEARTLAWLAGQDDLTTAFENGDDVYRNTASAIYAKRPEDISVHPERFVGKTTILGAGYGMGGTKFRVQLKTFNVDLPQAECERIIQVYRQTYPAIPALWKEAGRVLEAIMNQQTTSLGRQGVLTVNMMGIRLPNGLYLRYPNLRKRTDPETGKDEIVYDVKKGRSTIPTRIYGGKLVENVCQALARIIIGEQMLMIARRYRVALTVHDAVAAIIPEAEAEEGRTFVETCMRIRPKWALGLPLNCESHMGRSYGK